MKNKHRKGSRKGEIGDTDEAHLFIHLYEQDTTDNNTLRNRWNSLSNDEQEYILFQMGEPRKDFEETFNQSSYEGSRKGSRKGYTKSPTIVDGKSPMEYLKMMYAMHGLYNEEVVIDSGDEIKAEEYLRRDASYNFDSYEDFVRDLADDYEYKRKEGILGGRKGSRKGAEPFATSGFNKAVNGITGTLKSKPVMNTLKRTTGTKDQRNQAIIENNANKETKANRQKKVNEIRKGSGPLCDMGNISGKGSRPDNLGQISSGIVAGRKRSIHLEGEYSKESRKGSQKGSRKGSIPRDVKTIIDNGVDIDGIEYDFNKVRNILESQGYNEFEIDDFIDEYMLDEMEKQLRQGSRKGSRKGSSRDDEIVQEILDMYEKDNIDQDRLENLLQELPRDRHKEIVNSFAISAINDDHRSIR